MTCVDSESVDSLDWQQDATERKTCDSEVPPRGGGAAVTAFAGQIPRLPETESQRDSTFVTSILYWIVKKGKLTSSHSELQVYKSLWLDRFHLSTPNAAIGS